MNTRHIAELIERGELNGIKEAMEQSLAPGSQTFEQALFRLHAEKTITLEEALSNADSPSNLNWLINNAQIQAADAQPVANKSTQVMDFKATNTDGASFHEFTLNADNN